MLKIEDIAPAEMHALLQRGSFGHLGCARDGRPYVLPMNYAYDGKELYFFTTEGMKTQFIAANPHVCLQVEEITDSTHWRSVMVTGRAHRVTRPKDLEQAMQLISERNPSLVPAVNQTEIGAWRRPARMAVYKVVPEAVYGRRTL